MRRQVLVWLFLVLLAGAEADKATEPVVVLQNAKQMITSAGERMNSIVKKIMEAALARLSPERQKDAINAVNKIAAQGVKEEVGSMINLALEWRAVESEHDEGTMYDRMTRMLATEEGESMTMTANNDNSFLARRARSVGSSRGSSVLNEAHSVPAAFLFWMALLFYGLSRNVSNSNPSASGYVLTAEAVREDLMTSSTSKPTAVRFQNPSTQTSSLSANFFLGFASISFFLAVWFAPPAMRAKLMTTALIAIGMAKSMPEDKSEDKFNEAIKSIYAAP